MSKDSKKNSNTKISKEEAKRLELIEKAKSLGVDIEGDEDIETLEVIIEAYEEDEEDEPKKKSSKKDDKKKSSKKVVEEDDDDDDDEIDEEEIEDKDFKKAKKQQRKESKEKVKSERRASLDLPGAQKAKDYVAKLSKKIVVEEKSRGFVFKINGAVAIVITEIGNNEKAYVHFKNTTEKQLKVQLKELISNELCAMYVGNKNPNEVAINRFDLNKISKLKEALLICIENNLSAAPKKSSKEEVKEVVKEESKKSDKKKEAVKEEVKKSSKKEEAKKEELKKSDKKKSKK